MELAKGPIEASRDIILCELGYRPFADYTRCYKSRRDCIWAESLPKQKRRRGPSRIHQVEEKIDRLVAQVTDRDASKSSRASIKDHRGGSSSESVAERGVLSPATTLDAIENHDDDDEDDEDGQPLNSIQEIAKLHSFDPAGDESKTTARSRAPANDGRLISYLATVPDAEDLLTEYRTMSDSFPFVPITPDDSLEQLRTNKPTLLLSILAAASRRNRKLQVTLEKRYRFELAHRVFLQPRKDLALLQSILVYLAWAHFYLDYKIENLASLLHTAVAMIFDLRLLPLPSMLSLRVPQPRIKPNDEKPARRAVLGCFFLCSTITSEVSLPTVMKHSKYIDEYCEGFLNEPELESDKVLPILIKSRWIDNLISEGFDQSDQPYSKVSEGELLSRLELWKSELDDFQDQSSNEHHHYLLNLLSCAMESKLHLRRSLNLLSNDSDPFVNATSFATRQLDSLRLRLEAGKYFLDILVAIPTEETHLLIYPIWVTLPRMIMQTAIASIPIDSHPATWDVKKAQDHLRLNLYLDSLCYRMQSLTTTKPPTQPRPDYWAVLNATMQSVRAWYGRKTKRSATKSSLTGRTASLRSHDNSNSTWSSPGATMSTTDSQSLINAPIVDTPMSGSGSGTGSGTGMGMGMGTGMGMSFGHLGIGLRSTGDGFCPMLPPALRMDFGVDTSLDMNFDMSMLDFDSWGRDLGFL